jgi:hypothetical protein
MIAKCPLPRGNGHLRHHQEAFYDGTGGPVDRAQLGVPSSLVLHECCYHGARNNEPVLRVAGRAMKQGEEEVRAAPLVRSAGRDRGSIRISDVIETTSLS